MTAPGSPGDGACALGVDVGNAKVKLCLIDLASFATSWTSRGLPYDGRRGADRRRDFEVGLPAAIAEVVAGRRVITAVAVTSNGYAYAAYDDGARHTAGVLAAALPAVDVRIMTIDGRAIPAAEVERERGTVPFTNGVGAAHLARRGDALGAPASGLVIDTGGDTSQVNPVVDGEIDPVAAADPAGPLDHRLRHGKFVWVGSQSTPLEALADEVDVGGRRYPVIPRGVTFDSVASLLGLIPEAEAAKLTLFGLHPGRELALRAIAEAVNLDRTMVGDDALLDVARQLHDRAVGRLAEAVRRARATLPPRAQARAIVFGLGARLAAAALRRAGYAEDAIVDGADVVGPERAVIASVYGAAHHAAELALGARLPARLAAP